MSGKNIVRIALLPVMIAVASAAGATDPGGTAGQKAPVRNVIVMVADGCDLSIATLARWVRGGRLNLDGRYTGSVKTHVANSVIPDSAAAATAFATGHKTTLRFVSIGPRSEDLLAGIEPTADPYVPVATVLEGARLKGMAVGLVATSRITHATPAAFASHIDDRSKESEIMEHLVYQGLDVVFGGGARYLIPAGDRHTTSNGDTWPGSRTDGENLIGALRARGVRFIDSRQDLMSLNRGPVWGMFDGSHLAPDIDRDDLHPSQPSLAEMTEKAIELLSADREGFFLMVEGSQIDWAAHAHDPAWMVTEFLAFDDAVGRALAFAEKDRRTLVLVFPDHSTGGLSLGRGPIGAGTRYDNTTVAALIDPIKDADITLRTLIDRYAGASPSQIRKAFVRHWGAYWNRLTDEQAAEILRLGADGGAVASYISERFTLFGWTTHGHTGDDVPLWSYGPRRPVGTFDNTELARIVADALGVDLARATDRLFADVADLFPQYKVDGTDPANLVLMINGHRMPVGKDIVETGTRQTRVGGIVIHAPKIDRFFIPMDAARAIR